MPMNPRLLRPRLSGDPDALRYIAAVQQADGNTLEPAIRKAITDFVVGCKQDGIWTAIKASCILMGARTLSGALTPLVGTAPTNNGPFVSGDYNRETGLIGDGSTKYIDTNRANGADPQDNYHTSIYLSDIGGLSTRLIGGNANTYASGDDVIGRAAIANSFVRNRNSGAVTSLPNLTNNSFTGVSRSSSASFIFRANGSSNSHNLTSQTPSGNSVRVFGGGNAAVTGASAARIAFYSVGQSLDLALLDSRVSTLYTAIGAAI